MTPKVTKRVVNAPSTPRDRRASPHNDANDLRSRASASREQARAIVRETIAARARAEQWRPWTSRPVQDGAVETVGQGTIFPAQRHGAHLLVPAVPDAVRTSRRLVRDVCELMGLSDVAGIAELLAGEIATNVVLHTHTPWLRLVAEVNGGTLRVCVSDTDRRLPTVQMPSVREPRGRGLMLVNSLSKEWGAVQRPTGKIVWFTLSTEAPRPESSH
jgi:anti-sigma regulatory factor (Ser/Thr protein kinase)